MHRSSWSLDLPHTYGEIREIADRVMLSEGGQALHHVLAQINIATAASDWPAVLRWHRVKVRIARLQWLEDRCRMGDVDPFFDTA